MLLYLDKDNNGQQQNLYQKSSPEFSAQVSYYIQACFGGESVLLYFVS